MADTYVCSGAILMCSMGYTPCKLKVIGRNIYLAGQPPMANVMDYKLENIESFTQCHLSDPFPKPCRPMIEEPWVGGNKEYIIDNQAALLKSSNCFCTNGGVISIIDDGQKGENPWIEKQPQNNKNSQKPDNLKLWDVYWEKKLVKDSFIQQFPTKLRFIPQQEKVDLILLFYFEYDDDAIYDKKNANCSLIFEIPDTIYQPSEYTFSGVDVMKGKTEIKIVIDGEERVLYKYTIKNFSSDLTEAVFPQ